MKKLKLFILLPAFILPALIQFPSFAQGVIKAESGARIVSTTGSYWVVKNGFFALTSQSATNPAVMANLNIEPSGSLTLNPKAT